MNSLSLCKCITLVCGRWEDVSNKVTGSVERFDLKLHQWSPLSGLPHPVSDTAAKATGCMYSVAMMLIIKSYHVHRPMTAQHASGSPWWPPKICDLGAAVSLGSYVYVVGGVYQSCLRYAPAKDRWTELSGPRLVHANAPAVVWQGRVLV